MSNPLSIAANQFAMDLFRCYLRRHGDKYKNLLLCPYLIFHSLAMMLVGAEGQTAAQLKKVLHVPENADLQHSSSNTSLGPNSSIRCSHINLLSLAAAKKRLHHSGSRSTIDNKDNVDNSNNNQNPEKTLNSMNKIELSSAIKPVIQLDEATALKHREYLLLTEQLLHGNHDFVHIASFIYIDKTAKRTEKFKQILRDYYETKPKKILFDDTDLMVKTINEDVARTTENIYNEILSKQEALKFEKTFMLLVNAVFFRGFWSANFTKVSKLPFYNRTLSDKQKFDNVNMMSKLDYLKIYEDKELEAKCVRLTFEASDLQMMIVLPVKKDNDSTYLCDKMTATKINELIKSHSSTKAKFVKLTMPIFCVDSGKISIQSTLVEMGASDIFNKQQADMSGLCSNKKVWLNKILHRCFIICDNRGSITSGSTEKARKRLPTIGNQDIEEFLVDHPFMYLIIDSVTKTVLLSGLYRDPRETLEVVHETQLNPDEAHSLLTEGVYKT